MNFKEAVLSGRKVKSEYWKDDNNLDTTVFSDVLEDWLKDILCSTAKPLTWKEILGNWEFVD